MSNSMIYGGHFENMQIRPLRCHFSACQHWIQHTKLPLIKVSNPFLHKMPVLVNFSDFFPDYKTTTRRRFLGAILFLYRNDNVYMHARIQELSSGLAGGGGVQE